LLLAELNAAKDRSDRGEIASPMSCPKNLKTTRCFSLHRRSLGNACNNFAIERKNWGQRGVTPNGA
jgi:hypothetical protein